MASRAGAARRGRGTPLAGRQPHGGARGDAMIAATSTRIVGAVLCSLLAFAASASADCAWVLWLNHTGVVGGDEIDLWIPLNASLDNPNCQRVLGAPLQANSRAANPADALTL